MNAVTLIGEELAGWIDGRGDEEERRLDAREIGAALAPHFKEIALALLGEPTQSTRKEWRWRRRGSLALTLSNGLWHDFEAGDGGDALKLVMVTLQLRLPDALAWAAAWLGEKPAMFDRAARRNSGNPTGANQHAEGLDNIQGQERPKAPTGTSAQAVIRRLDKAAAAGDDRAARESNIEIALRLWAGSIDPHGTIVKRYLEQRRAALPAHASDVIRFHPRCPFKGERRPAMVALMRDICTNEPCGVHRTALLPDGSDRDRTLGKAMLGRAGGAAIKLSPDGEVDLGLGIAEGIESALAVIGIGWRPVWACGSAGSIAKFPVLAGIDELTIFADRDEAGRRAAQECARRWVAAGRAATIRLPRGDETDWNDARRP